MNINLVLVYDPCGKIVGVGVSFPGNFHYSKSTVWYHAHNYAMSLPDRNTLSVNSNFVTSKKLKGEIVKLKVTSSDDGDKRTVKFKALTYAHQCAEWVNNTLTGEF